MKFPLEIKVSSMDNSGAAVHNAALKHHNVPLDSNPGFCYHSPVLSSDEILLGIKIQDAVHVFNTGLFDGPGEGLPAGLCDGLISYPSIRKLDPPCR